MRSTGDKETTICDELRDRTRPNSINGALEFSCSISFVDDFFEYVLQRLCSRCFNDFLIHLNSFANDPTHDAT